MIVSFWKSLPILNPAVQDVAHKKELTHSQWRLRCHAMKMWRLDEITVSQRRNLLANYNLQVKFQDTDQQATRCYIFHVHCKNLNDGGIPRDFWRWSIPADRPLHSIAWESFNHQFLPFMSLSSVSQHILKNSEKLNILKKNWYISVPFFFIRLRAGAYFLSLCCCTERRLISPNGTHVAHQPATWTSGLQNWDRHGRKRLVKEQ